MILSILGYLSAFKAGFIKGLCLLLLVPFGISLLEAVTGSKLLVLQALYFLWLIASIMEGALWTLPNWLGSKVFKRAKR